MLSIPVGHTLAAVVGALGPIAELSAVLANGRTTVRVADKGTDIPMTSPDQVLLQGLLESGAPISLHYRGGTCHGSGFVREVNGTEGELRLTAPFGHSRAAVPAQSGSERSKWRRLGILSHPAAGRLDQDRYGRVRARGGK